MAIDIGAAAINRAYAFDPGYTLINYNNPANADGTITSIQIYANINLEDCAVGIFYLVDGDDFHCRSAAAIGNVTAGSTQTFGGQTLAVLTGDYIGMYYSAGKVDYALSGGAGAYYDSGDNCYVDSEENYDLLSGDIFSLWGTGTEAGGAAHTKALSDSIAISDSIIKAFGGFKSDSMGLADSISKEPEPIKADSLSIGDSISKESELIKVDSFAISDSIVKAPELIKADSLNIGDAVVKDVSLNKADSVTIADSISKLAGIIKSDAMAIADTLVKAVSLIKSDAIAIIDALVKAVGLIKSDTVSISDILRKTVSIVKSDTMAIADSIVLGIGHFLNFLDTVIITDSLVGIHRLRLYLRQTISRMDTVRLTVSRMAIKRLNISRMPLYRWIIRRFTA